jgi:hypothetical protein
VQGSGLSGGTPVCAYGGGFRVGWCKVREEVGVRTELGEDVAGEGEGWLALGGGRGHLCGRCACICSVEVIGAFFLACVWLRSFLRSLCELVFGYLRDRFSKEWLNFLVELDSAATVGKS